MRDKKDDTPKVVNTTQSNGTMNTVIHVNPCQRIIIEQCQFCQTMLIPNEIANHERSCTLIKQTQSPPEEKVIYCGGCQKLVLQNECKTHAKSCQELRRQITANETPSIQSPPKKKIFFCGYCNQVLLESECKTHAIICHKLRRKMRANQTTNIHDALAYIQCQFCHSFFFSDKLGNHERSCNQRKRKQSSPEEKGFSCGYCKEMHGQVCPELRKQKMDAQKHQFLANGKSHQSTNDALASIQFCHSFFFSDKLGSHERSCTQRKQKVFSCGYCKKMHGQVCPELRKQKMNEQKHQFLTNGKSHKQSYKCQYCKMEIGSSWVLEIHEHVCKEMHNIKSCNQGTLLNSFIHSHPNLITIPKSFSILSRNVGIFFY